MTSRLSKPQRPPDPAEVEGTERVLADVPTSVYRRVKHRCVARGISLKRYLLGLIEADLIATKDDGTPVPTSARASVRAVK